MARIPNSAPRGYQQLTSLAAAAGLTVPKQATIALITVEVADVRWRDDGTDPTASVGMPIKADTTLLYDGDLAAIKFILVSGSPKVNVSYY